MTTQLMTSQQAHKLLLTLGTSTARAFLAYYIFSFGAVLWLQLWQNGSLSVFQRSPKCEPAVEQV